MPRGQIGKRNRRAHYARRSIKMMLRQKYITAVLSEQQEMNQPETESDFS